MRSRGTLFLSGTLLAGSLLASFLLLPQAVRAQTSDSSATPNGITPLAAQAPVNNDRAQVPMNRDGAGASMGRDGATASMGRDGPTASMGRDAPMRAVADPVVGSVEGHPIYLSELGEASKTLPENLHGLPFDTLYPVLLERLIDHESLVIMARRNGLEETRAVRREIQAATERILEGAYLEQTAAPLVTEQAIRARYQRLYGNHAATQEVRARHILVTTEAEARKVLADLQKGADFATMASVLSKDPDAAKGGDLGFFRREQVWPGFADVAFSLQPGQIGPTPIKNEFGWHVIKVEERRLVAPPSLSDVHDQLRQDLLAAAVRQTVAEARSQLEIHRFNLDGSGFGNDPQLDVTGDDSARNR
jgi:peptidyl-prolyl cis-trans isomerase C